MAMIHVVFHVMFHVDVDLTSVANKHTVTHQSTIIALYKVTPQCRIKEVATGAVPPGPQFWGPQLVSEFCMFYCILFSLFLVFLFSDKLS